MYNKKVLREATKNLDRTVAPAKKKDMIVDPMGQWKYPGQNTRIPGNDITMQGVPYPVWAVPNIGTPQMMYPGQDYYFPGADHVDEYPQIAQRGGDISIPQLNQYEDGGEYDLTQEEIDDLIAQGYEIEDVDTEEYKKGGTPKSLPKKKNSKAYSRSLTATNKLFAQSNLTKKTKSRKNKFFDPTSKYLQDGGVPEDYTQFQNFTQTLPSNLQDPEYQYGNPDQYDLYGMWRTAGKPASFTDVQDTDYFPLEPDGTYHGFSVGDDGILLKPMSHSTTWKEVMNSQLNTAPYFRENMLIRNEQGRLQYVPRRQDGGPYNTTGPTQVDQEQEYDPDAMNAMMKARFAYAQMHGNPAAQRMVNAPDQPYVYTGQEYDRDFNMPVGVPEGAIGTHYMASFGNYAVPFIQQGPTGLYFNELPTYKDREAIRFENEGEAGYFGGHYKEIAPDASYREYAKGGFQDDIKRRRKLLRDWTYGASIGMLHKAQEGLDTGVVESKTPWETAPEGFSPNVYEGKDVTVKAQGPEWARFQREYQNTKPWEDFLYDEQKKYLRRHKGLNKAAGVSMDNFPEAERIRIKQKYDEKMNNYVTRRLGQNFGFNPNRRGEWLDLLNDREKQIVAGSKYGSKLQPAAWSRFLSGLRSTANLINPTQYKITADIPGFTEAENKQSLQSLLEPLEILAPLDVPGIAIANKMKNMNAENPSWYSGEQMANVSLGDVMAVNPLTYIADLPALPKGLVNLGKGVAKGSKAIGKYLTTQTPLRNAYNYNPLANRLGEYNRVVGQDAIDDIVESGLVRVNENAGVAQDLGPFGIVNRTTPYPSFGKAKPQQVYADQVINQGKTPYIISTDRSMRPSTLGRHGKGKTQFPVDDAGNYITGFPANEAKVFEFGKPHWLKGYKPVSIKGSTDNVRQFTTRGPIGQGVGTGLVEQDISKAIDDQINWITSEEYYKRRSANTGETYDQIYRDVNKMINNARDAKFDVNAKLPTKIQGQQTPRGLSTFWGPPTVDISSAANNPPMVLKHEVGHLYSPAGFDVDVTKLHRGYDNPNVANLPANKRGVYANYPQLGDKELDGYLQLGFEQQVRHLNARDQILNRFNLPKDAQLNEDQVRQFVDDWSTKMNNRVEGWQDRDFNYKYGKEEDYDDLWNEEFDVITKNMLKEKYGVDDINQYQNLSEVEKAAFKEERRQRLSKRITDVLNKAWVGVPAVVGAGAAATQGESPRQLGQLGPQQFKKGGNLTKAQSGLAVMNYLIGKGLTKEQAAGIAGNIQQESGFSPKARSKSGYIGIAQWDPNNRWPAVQKYIKSQGYDPMSLEGQLEGLYWEANKRGDWKKIAATQTPEQASAAWLRHFEISGEKPGMAGYNRRVKYANDLASSYEPPMEKQIAFQVPPVAEVGLEDLPIPSVEIGSLQTRPAQQLIQSVPTTDDIALRYTGNDSFQYGGDVAYEDIDLTPEEIDWYLANGYDLEDLGDSESFDDYLPEAQTGFVIEGKTNVTPVKQKTPAPVPKKVEPQVVTKDVVSTSGPIFIEGKTNVAPKKETALPKKEKELPKKQTVLPTDNAEGYFANSPYAYKPLTGFMQDNPIKSEENAPTPYVLGLMDKPHTFIGGIKKPAVKSKPLTSEEQTFLEEKIKEKIYPEAFLKEKIKEKIYPKVKKETEKEEAEDVKQLNPKIKNYQSIVTKIDGDIQKVYYELTNPNLTPEQKTAVREKYKSLTKKRASYISAINNVKRDEVGWFDALVDKSPTIGKPLQKEGWADQPSYMNYDLPKFETYSEKKEKEDEAFKQKKRFEELNPGKSEFTRWKFRAAASNDDPLRVAIYGTRGERANQNVEIDSPGAIMHFLDQSPESGYIHSNTKNYYDKLKDNDYVGYLKPNGDGTHSVQYKPRKEFNKDNLYKNTFLVRQVKFDDIDFNTKVKDDNFAGHTYPTIKGTKQAALPISSDPDENVYDYSSGQSVVFIFKYKGKIRYQHFAGSRNEIKKEGQDIKKMYNLNDGQLTIGLADAGSYSSAVSGRITNDKLNSKDYGYYNLNSGTGAGMAILP